MRRRWFAGAEPAGVAALVSLCARRPSANAIMVGKAMGMKPTDDLSAALRDAYPELAQVRVEQARDAGGGAVYLVGGAVRDLLLGRGRADIDLVVIGAAADPAASLGADPMEHERFATAKVKLDGHEIDIATARTESYEAPGALPDVKPAGRIEDDLTRRDFTINAMALPLADDAELIDPYNGL